MAEGHVRAVRELVHEEPVAHEQRRDHAAGRDAERLHEQCLDHEIDQDRPGQRLDVVPHTCQQRALRRAAAALPRLRDDAIDKLVGGLACYLDVLPLTQI